MGEIGRGIPNTMGSFNKLQVKASENGALAMKDKELIALGIAIAVRCDGSIAMHVHDALKSGANEDEILEAIGVAIMMGGSPSVMTGCQAYEALRQFQSERKLAGAK